MVKKITSLTDIQKSALDDLVTEWINHGWSTEPADREKAEAAMKQCYKFSNIPWHGNVVWVNSPLAGSAAFSIASQYFKTGAVDGAVYGAVDGAVYGAVSGAVRNAVSGAVRNAVYDAVDGAVRNAVSDEWYKYLYGNLWVYWQVRSVFFREVCGLELVGDLWDRAKAYENIAKSCGWWWPHKNFIIACDRPSVLNLEEIGPRGWGSHRLHSENGPAISWGREQQRESESSSDQQEWELYFWHGVRVPKEVIYRSWTPEQILQEPNSEIRRCAIEAFGWDVFVDYLNLQPIGEPAPDPGNDGNMLTLYRAPNGVYAQPVNVLLCTNGSVERDGTRRRFGLTVEADITDPVAAAAWGYGLTKEEYLQMEVRR